MNILSLHKGMNQSSTLLPRIDYRFLYMPKLYGDFLKVESPSDLFSQYSIVVYCFEISHRWKMKKPVMTNHNVEASM